MLRPMAQLGPGIGIGGADIGIGRRYKGAWRLPRPMAQPWARHKYRPWRQRYRPSLRRGVALGPKAPKSRKITATNAQHNNSDLYKLKTDLIKIAEKSL